MHNRSISSKSTEDYTNATSLKWFNTIYLLGGVGSNIGDFHNCPLFDLLEVLVRPPDRELAIKVITTSSTAGGIGN